MNRPCARRRTVWPLSKVCKTHLGFHRHGPCPHTPQEKADFLKAPNGSIGMETSLAATLTALEGELTLLQVIEKMSTNPARILGIPAGPCRWRHATWSSSTRRRSGW